VLSARSSSSGLVREENILFGGSGSNRTVTVTPVAGRAGVATLTIIVDDGTEIASTSFQLTVNMPPSLDIVVNPAEPHPAGFAVARAWYWDIDGDKEGWSSNSHLELEAGSPIGGLIRGSSAGNDPQWVSPVDLGVLAVPEVISEFRFRKESSDPTRLDLFWADDNDGFSADRRTTIDANDLPRDGEFHVVRLHYRLLMAGTLSGLRLDPVSDTDGIGRAFDLDYLRIYVFDENPAGTPRLRIERRGENEVRLSWRGAVGAWTLQSSSELSGGFTDIAVPFVIEDSEYVVYDLIESSRQFYRLIESSVAAE
jgi:hypothetical protein